MTEIMCTVHRIKISITEDAGGYDCREFSVVERDGKMAIKLDSKIRMTEKREMAATLSNRTLVHPVTFRKTMFIQDH